MMLRILVVYNSSLVIDVSTRKKPHLPTLPTMNPATSYTQPSLKPLRIKIILQETLSENRDIFKKSLSCPLLSPHKLNIKTLLLHQVRMSLYLNLTLFLLMSVVESLKGLLLSLTPSGSSGLKSRSPLILFLLIPIPLRMMILHWSM